MPRIARRFRGSPQDTERRRPLAGRLFRRNANRERERRPMATTEKQNEFAFPAKKKEPIGDADHVRNAVARFNQVRGVTDSERDGAWRRIRAAARKHGVEIEARGWRSLRGGGKKSRKRF
jgi:hypothetical protein